MKVRKRFRKMCKYVNKNVISKTQNEVQIKELKDKKYMYV